MLVDDFTASMFAAVHTIMLDVLAAVTRKDIEETTSKLGQGHSGRALVCHKPLPAREHAALDRMTGIVEAMRRGMASSD